MKKKILIEIAKWTGFSFLGLLVWFGGACSQDNKREDLGDKDAPQEKQQDIDEGLRHGLLKYLHGSIVGNSEIEINFPSIRNRTIYRYNRFEDYNITSDSMIVRKISSDEKEFIVTFKLIAKEGVRYILGDGGIVSYVFANGHYHMIPDQFKEEAESLKKIYEEIDSLAKLMSTYTILNAYYKQEHAEDGMQFFEVNQINAGDHIKFRAKVRLKKEEDKLLRQQLKLTSLEILEDPKDMMVVMHRSYRDGSLTKVLKPWPFGKMKYDYSESWNGNIFTKKTGKIIEYGDISLDKIFPYDKEDPKVIHVWKEELEYYKTDRIYRLESLKKRNPVVN